MSRPQASDADVALLLEGTFPYVSGGVSSWINQIIRAFPEVRFAIVFLGSRRADYLEFKYELPANVVHFEEHFLYDNLTSDTEPAMRPGDAKAFRMVERLIAALREGLDSPQAMDAFREVTRHMHPDGALQLDDFLYSTRAWDILCEVYRRDCTDPSFVDFFWTVRIMFQPLWLLARVASQLIPVKAVHCASTGYAGFLGALLAQSRSVPLVLSEHGIYTKERKIDLFKSEWIRDNRNVFQRDPTELSYFRQMWIHFFEWLGRYCYTLADPIIALYEANRQRQIADGAAPERSFNIPNGIQLARFAPLRAQRPAEPPPVLCLIGRVVPIKDIKTFVRAMRRVVNQLPQAEGWIAGPADEDAEYAHECHNLVRSLGLEENVRFLGFQRVEDLMPRIGLVVLSSISEALPLVLLEGYAAGVPAVATDVGSCRQLVEGLDEQDKLLGHSGSVVPIADPQRLADAALALLQDATAWQAASQAAIARVERYYTDTLMFERYGAVYERALGRPMGAL
ncbi:GT4 family glycosyltransferase PelF [Simplicispira suum]|uniref:Glycosyl transferase family 1 n=1 Tax=Simplicispira suum TaxID=2109915 RepID=A0A2S0N0Y6_9BURK|nr:GT4 family glycosyltransferase PelF [Simplicispira suum]AVO41810.1 glycosyl transferase family 1 [Simplicispira suum]